MKYNIDRNTENIRIFVEHLITHASDSEHAQCPHHVFNALCEVRRWLDDIAQRVTFVTQHGEIRGEDWSL